MKAKNFIQVMFCVFCLSVSAEGEDSLKTKYDINDPRNPNCPCHKYQKLADDEYKALLASKNKGQWEQNDVANHNISDSSLNFDKNTDNLNQVSSNGTDKIKKHKTNYSKKHKRKKKGKKYNKWRKIWEVSNWDIWKRVPKTDSCHRW